MTLRPGVEALLEELEERAESGDPLVFIAPTGYGKTSGVLEAVRRLYGRVPGFVHALPLRAILEQVYEEARGKLDVPVGYQAGGLLLPGKSPFMAAVYNVVTFDSLLYNLMRVNVAETWLGHYEAPRAHILSSLVVLDEAHLGLSGGLAGSLEEAVQFLTESRTPLLVETATLPEVQARRLRDSTGGRGVALTPWVSSRDECVEGLAGGLPVRIVEDPEFYEAVAATRWAYRVVEEARLAERILEDADAGRKVLVITRGPREAVELYERLAGQARVALLHGRLAPIDRGEAFKRLKSADVLVGTSAIEAGVNVDFDVLYTSVDGVADTPSALVQRMGRVARRPGRLDEATVYFYGGGAERVAEAWSGVNPRLPCDWRGWRGYYRLLTRVDAGQEGRGSLVDALRRIAYRGPLLDPASLARVLEEIRGIACDYLRDHPLIPVAPVELLGCEGCKCDPRWEDVARSTLAVEPRLLAKLARTRRLVVMDGRVCTILVEHGDPEGAEYQLTLSVKPVLDEELVAEAEKKCKLLVGEIERRRVVAILVSGYRRGLGLAV